MPRKQKGGSLDLNRVLQMFYQHQMLIKTLHFQTKHYGAHKALDVHLAAFNLTFDRFMEVAQGIDGTVNIKEINIKAKTLTDSSATGYLKSFVKGVKEIWKAAEKGGHADLMAILDEVSADTNQLIYLLTFK